MGYLFIYKLFHKRDKFLIVYMLHFESKIPSTLFYGFNSLYSQLYTETGAFSSKNSGLLIDSVQLHLCTPTHASIYLGMLSLCMQNFIWWVKNLVLQFLFWIGHQYCSLIILFLQKMHKRYTSVAFTCFCLPKFGRLQKISIM